jgi:large subunit ribosomal protein L10
MDNPRAEKVAVVEEVRERFIEADAAILTEYRGLKVKELATLRRSLTPAGGDYKVYKNTLVRFAARDAGLEALEPLLEGPTAVAFVKGDAAAVAKALRDFARTQPLLVIKGGVLGSKVLSRAETTALADLPSREVLLAQLAGALAAPLRQLAGLLQALPRNLAYGLAALRDRQAEGAESPSAEPAASDVPAADAPAADAPAGAPAVGEVAEDPAVEPAPAEPEGAAAEAPETEAPEAEVADPEVAATEPEGAAAEDAVAHEADPDPAP